MTDFLSSNLRPAERRKLPKKTDFLSSGLCLLVAATIAGCTQERVRFIAPPPERTAPVPAPVIPPATTPCSFEPLKLCNTDTETAGVIADYDAALARANAELEWLRTFFQAVPTKKP